MKTLTTLSIAIMMAFSFSGLTAFTAPSAQAGDLCEDWVYCEGQGFLIEDLALTPVTPANAGEWCEIINTCGVYLEDDAYRGLLDDMTFNTFNLMTPANAGDDMSCIFTGENCKCDGHYAGAC